MSLNIHKWGWGVSAKSRAFWGWATATITIRRVGHRKRKIIQKRKVIIAGKAVCDQLPQEIYAEGRLSLTGYANVFQAKQKINISGEAMEYGDDELLFLLLAA